MSGRGEELGKTSTFAVFRYQSVNRSEEVVKKFEEKFAGTRKHRELLAVVKP